MKELEERRLEARSQRKKMVKRHTIVDSKEA